MRILIAGDWHSDLHEEVTQQALRALGHDVDGFKWFSYFSEKQERTATIGNFLKRAQNKYVCGPLLTQVNQDFQDRAKALRPQMIFIYRGTHITARTIRAIKAELPGVVVVGYNNDDPFAPSQPSYLWRHFLASVPEYDLVLAYRHRNLKEFVAVGAKRVELLRSWYVPGRNYPMAVTPDQQQSFACDVVFVGHFEPDSRLEYLEAIVQAGFRLRLFGPAKYWNQPLRNSEVLRHLAPVRMVWGEDYNRALCGAKVALCFLSKLNRDTYTRRCFEIPASGALLLSEHSDDLAGMYREGQEADYFRNKDEMLEKISLYVSDEGRRRAVAEAGHVRVRADGHDVESRMRQVIAWVEEINAGF